MILDAIQNNATSDMRLDGSNWYVVVDVQMRHEFRIPDRLKLAGGNTFLPFYARTGNRSGGKKIVHLPPFHRNLFDNIDDNRASQGVRFAAKGVVKTLDVVSGYAEAVGS
jgi:hypothetical protein